MFAPFSINPISLSISTSQLLNLVSAVGIAINAQNALSEMGMGDVVQKAGGVRMNSCRTIVVSGYSTASKSEIQDSIL